LIDLLFYNYKYLIRLNNNSVLNRDIMHLTHDVNLTKSLTQKTFYQAVKFINRYNGFTTKYLNNYRKWYK